METLLGGIIGVVSEHFEFDYRNKSNTLIFCKVSDYQDYDGKIKYIGFSTKLSSTNVRLPIGTSREEIKHIIVEK